MEQDTTTTPPSHLLLVQLDKGAAHSGAPAAAILTQRLSCVRAVRCWDEQGIVILMLHSPGKARPLKFLLRSCSQQNSRVHPLRIGTCARYVGPDVQCAAGCWKGPCSPG